MNISKQGMMEIAALEGMMLKPYYDSVGVLTIGIGHTHTDHKIDMTLGKEYSIQEMIDLFKLDIQRYVRGVAGALRVDVSQSQFDALCSFHYNTGGFVRSTLKARINAGADAQSIYNGFLMWNKPKEIIKRRTNEARLYRDGIYTNNGTTTLYDVRDNGHTIFSSARSIDISKYF